MSSKITTVVKDKNYISAVDLYVRGNLDSKECEELEEDLDRLYLALVTLKQDIEMQLSIRRGILMERRWKFLESGDDGSAWLEAKAKEEEWRTRAVRILRSTEASLMSVKEMRKAERTGDGEVRQAV